MTGGTAATMVAGRATEAQEKVERANRGMRAPTIQPLMKVV